VNLVLNKSIQIDRCLNKLCATRAMVAQ
jgi:hypothetical protein